MFAARLGSLRPPPRAVGARNLSRHRARPGAGGGGASAEDGGKWSRRKDRFGNERRVRADGTIPPRPTIAQVKSMPRFTYEYSNEMLFFAARDPNSHDIHQERLIREIMVVDDVDYDEAAERMRVLYRHNFLASRYMLMPLHFGLGLCGVSAVGCFPLVFHYPTAAAFADLVAAVPEAPIEDVACANVGTWTWAWMEPMIGTASFSILCLQLLRQSLIANFYKPLRDVILSNRANNLADAFPTYDRPIVKDFGRSQPMRYIELGPGFRPYLLSETPAPLSFPGLFRNRASPRVRSPEFCLRRPLPLSSDVVRGRSLGPSDHLSTRSRGSSRISRDVARVVARVVTSTSTRYHGRRSQNLSLKPPISLRSALFGLIL
jgi:hypothetical protein